MHIEFLTDYNTVYTTTLSMLTAIITGGFVLVFVEIGNRKNRESDRFEVEFRPFMNKLSAYLRFISWMSPFIIYPKNLDAHEKYFKELVKGLAHYGGRLIMSGSNFGTEWFTAEKLDHIANDINNVWYWHDKMHPLRLHFDARKASLEFIKKELKDINPEYLSKTEDVDLVAKVSGEFYTDIYQPKQHILSNHEEYVKHYGRQTVFVIVSVIFVLGLLVSLLFCKLPMLVLQLSGVSVIILLLQCLALLSVDIKKQIKCYYIVKYKVMEVIKLVRKFKNKIFDL